MNKYQKSLIDFMKTGEIEIELRHLSKRELIKLVEEQQQRINKAIEYIENENYKEENICIINGVKVLSILRGEE